jgi:pyruvate formate-lyase/glycerol dehydratase family glycyl radical enzyme
MPIPQFTRTGPDSTAPRKRAVGGGAAEITDSPRLKSIREAMHSASYELCTQKAELLTDYFKRTLSRPGWLKALEAGHYRLYRRSLIAQSKGQNAGAKSTAVNRFLLACYRRLGAHDRKEVLNLHAQGLAHVLQYSELKVYDNELIVGNASSKRIGAPIHPDYGGGLLAGEIDTLGTRKNNPIRILPEQRDRLTKDVFPFWFNRSVLGLTPLYAQSDQLLDRITEGRHYVLTQIAGISHLTPDYPRVLSLGYRGIEAQILKELADTAPGSEKRAFHESALQVIRAAMNYGVRWRSKLNRLAAEERDPTRRAELKDVAELFTQVPEHPAETFHQALQSIFISHVVIHQESFQHGVSFGRMDQYLYPYYRRDIDEGRLTEAKAVELLGCFLAKAAELLPLFFDRATEYFSGLSSASGITLAGRKADGTDAVNELSFLFLRAYDQMRLRQPNLHVRLYEGTDGRFFERCAEVVAGGGGMPAFFNDEAIEKKLTSKGVAAEHARDFAVVGCAEWGAPYRSFPAAGAGFINLASALELTLANGLESSGQMLRQMGPATGDVHRLKTVEKLLLAYRQQLRHLLEEAAEGNNAIERVHRDHRPTPFLSTMVGGCVEAGMDVTSGGATYNSAGFQGVGIADVADSFASIEALVFEEKRLTLAELVQSLKRNYDGDEWLRGYILNRLPKYGENEGRSEFFAGKVSAIYAEEVERLQSIRGGNYAAGMWTMTTHQGFGRRCGALPSGRLSGESLSNGVSPRNGADRRGPTSTMSSTANLAPLGNGYVLNMRMDPRHLTEGSRSAILRGLVYGYFAMGGMQAQFNVVDPATLIEAKKNPDKFRHLVVRISGYSAYFNDLTDEMKDELIARTNHGAS